MANRIADIGKTSLVSVGYGRAENRIVWDSSIPRTSVSWFARLRGQLSNQPGNRIEFINEAEIYVGSRHTSRCDGDLVLELYLRTPTQRATLTALPIRYLVGCGRNNILSLLSEEID